MFAPPPVQLTRAEIERRKQRQSADADSAARSPLSGGSDPKTPSSLHRTESTTSKDIGSPVSGRKGGWLFGRGEKSLTSSPVSALLGPPPELSKQHPGDRAASKASSEKAKPKTLSEAFGENPRKAPTPPRRPARPPSDVPLLPGAFPTTPLPATPPPQRPVPFAPVSSDAPRPVPGKSPERLGVARHGGPVDPFGGQSASANVMLNQGVVTVRPKNGEQRLQSSRTSPTAGRISKLSPTKGDAPGSKTSSRRSGRFNDKIDKNTAVGRRSSAAAYLRSAVLDMEQMKMLGPPRSPRRATDSELQTLSGSMRPLAEELSWKRRQRGETMSMLLDDGFFPLQGYVYSHKNPNISVQMSLLPPLNLLNKDLPDTPSSIAPTPTELYQSSPTKSPRPTGRQRKKETKRRSPLAPLSVTDAKSNSTRSPPSGADHELSSSKLSVIPEGSTVSENTPPGSTSGVSTSLATRIHLRGGSVITLSPPELTAWKQTCYLQGPIKLPKPTMLPRKGSTASMQAFQEVVDQVYQEALNIPRRRSDDQIVDDICEFFDDFCLEEMGFADDLLGVLDVKIDEMEGTIEEIDETSAEIERYATPPHEMEATPVEKVVAKEIVERPILLPPVETEETLRARGIARLSQGEPPSPTTSSRRASTTSRKDSTILPLLPVPETTTPKLSHTVAFPSGSKSREDARLKDRPAATGGVDQGFDWNDDVEELDALSSWVAPAALPRKYGMQRNMSTRESKNPVKRMRRFVATASAML